MSNTSKVQPVANLSKSASNKVISNIINLDWSLKPMVRWMNLIGVAPFEAGDTGKSCSFKYIVRLIMFMSVVAIHFCLVIHTFLNARTLSTFYVHGVSTTALAWNFIIDNLNLTIYTVVGHVVLFLVTRSWLDVINSFKELDKHLAPVIDIYPKCRKVSTYLIIYVIISVLGSLMISAFDASTNDSSLLRKCLDVSGLITTIVPTTTLALFCTLTHLVALHLFAIRIRIISETSSCYPASVLLLESQRSQLKLWQRQHLLVSKTIDKLNQQFGFFLAVEVGFVFVGVINSSMFLLVSVMNEDGLLGSFSGVTILDLIVHLFLLTYFSTDIVNQISLIYKALAELVYQEPMLQTEVNLFLEQLAHMRLEIDALGFFNVNKQLFPSLIGTTLTYFLILLQFHTAEKS